MTDIVTALSSTSSDLLTGFGNVIVGLLEAVADIFTGSSAPTGE